MLIFFLRIPSDAVEDRRELPPRPSKSELASGATPWCGAVLGRVGKASVTEIDDLGVAPLVGGGIS